MNNIHRYNNTTSVTTTEVSSRTYLSPGFALFFIVIYFILIITTLIGNIAILFLFKHFTKLRSKTNYFIVSLSCSDIVNAVLVMPFELKTLLDGEKWTLSVTLCEFHATMRFLVLASSNMTLFAVSVYKFVVIKFPYCVPWMQSWKIASVIVFLWLYILISSCLPAFGWKDGPSFVSPEGECFMYYSKVWFVLFFTCNIVAPTFTMLVIYYLIFITAREHELVIRARRRTLTMEDRNKRSSFKAAYTLAKIIIVYFICWMPLIFLMIVYMIFLEFLEDQLEVNNNVNAMLITMQNTNAAINPVLYILWCADFRKVILGLFSKDTPRSTSATPENVIEETAV